MTAVVEVAVGVIRRDDTVFVTRRHANQHQGGKWEFPGGKREGNESLEHALARELAEEVGIQVAQSEHLITIEHDYGDKVVRLVVHCLTDFSGEPRGLEGQEGRWVPIAALAQMDFPDANVAIVNAITS